MNKILVTVIFLLSAKQIFSQLNSNGKNNSENVKPQSIIAGTYYAKRNPKECIKLLADSTFQHYWECDKSSPANFGWWSMLGSKGWFDNMIALSIEKDGKRINDWQKINDLRVTYGYNELDGNWLEWNNERYYNTETSDKSLSVPIDMKSDGSAEMYITYYNNKLVFLSLYQVPDDKYPKESCLPLSNKYKGFIYDGIKHSVTGERCNENIELYIELNDKIHFIGQSDHFGYKGVMQSKNNETPITFKVYYHYH